MACQRVEATLLLARALELLTERLFEDMAAHTDEVARLCYGIAHARVQKSDRS